MFGLPLLSLISLGIAALIALGLMISVMTGVSVPFSPFDLESMELEIERMKRVQRAHVTWGLIAVAFCLLGFVPFL